LSAVRYGIGLQVLLPGLASRFSGLSGAGASRAGRSYHLQPQAWYL